MTTLRCLPGVLSQFQQIYWYLCLTCIFWLREEGIEIEGNVKVLSFENVKITYYYQSVQKGNVRRRKKEGQAVRRTGSYASYGSTW
jgi:hypothetical protein